MNISKSISLFETAKKVIPGGVNSPVRAFKSVGGNPVFIKSGSGPRFTDADGNSYLDYIGSWGPHLFGHNAPFIKEAITAALENGTSFGAPTEAEVTMAELITSIVPSLEMVRMVNSGTEATMSAIRVARGYTGREKFIKFEGCYHGHADYFLIKAGSGALTFGVPTSPGVTKGNAADTLLAEFNNLDSVKGLFTANKGEIAAVIVEPVVGNMGCVPPAPGFLEGLRAICSEEGALLVFDEVMTGFRLAPGGAQELYNITPDLSTFGKVIGGGLPVGAFGGKREVMEKLAPLGPVYQAGTLSGNPLAMSAGMAALTYIKNNPGVYTTLEERSAQLHKGISEAVTAAGKSFAFNRVGSMMTLFFTETPVTGYAAAVTSDTALYGRFFHALLKRGIYFPPAQFEAFFVSSVHTEADINHTVAMVKEALAEAL